MNNRDFAKTRIGDKIVSIEECIFVSEDGFRFRVDGNCWSDKFLSENELDEFGEPVEPYFDMQFDMDEQGYPITTFGHIFPGIFILP